jgi:hypothetical protein
MILWLADRKPLLPRRGQPAPALWLTHTGSDALLALEDPTLFALPHPEGFAGHAWLRAPAPPEVRFWWADPAPPLGLAMPRPEEIFRQLAQSNETGPLSITAVMNPALEVPEPEWLGLVPTQSTVRVSGQLAGRRLMAPLVPRSWTNSDLLAQSVVQVLVNAEGRPLSWAVISPSGSKAADSWALAQARAARFERLPTVPGGGENPLAGLAWGEFVFQWHTLLPEATNTAGGAP